jgi:hypothetical protein
MKDDLDNSYQDSKKELEINYKLIIEQLNEAFKLIINFNCSIL